MKATEMTLRDYFAGQALIGLTNDAGTHVTQLDIAKASWAIANKMMKTRAQHPCPNPGCVLGIEQHTGPCQNAYGNTIPS